ncbi:hypothetical protein [Sphingobium yanoikuyae]|uniref:Uncharacterized protein n=1 Tax=Sphingobium yanoikuyae TaxID=13690 RepID=A0A3G2UZJ2_SPHYA|nr:hypothetical protein [Sphingobium yanoikuyae]AYO80104.1 hypothetical protein EBF16_26495 [Sphingobium yanoikuyae]
MDRLDLEATRGDAWRPVIEYAYAGSFPAGAICRMQWRLYEGHTGTPCLDIPACEYYDDWATAEQIAEGFARPGDRVLKLLPNITVPPGMPTGLNQPEAGEADRYFWDLAVIVDDVVLLRPIGGNIFVNKGVTRNDA